MAEQAILWTALPNGYSDDRSSLRVSLLVTPRLKPGTDPAELASFPDFMDWPATLAQSKFVLQFDGPQQVVLGGQDFQGPTRIDSQLGVPDSHVWTALFPATTLVSGFEFRDLSRHSILSYPVADTDALVRGLYSKLAASASDQLPTVSTFLDDPDWTDLRVAVRRNEERYTVRERDEETGRSGPIRDVRGQFRDFKRGVFGKPSLASNLALLQLFHTPPSSPRRQFYRKALSKEAKSRAEWLEYDQTALPQPDDFQKRIDFHQIVAAMSQYPTLLRRLGLVVDIVIPRNAFPRAPNKLLWVEVELPSGAPTVTRLPDASPRTHTLLSGRDFQAVPRPTLPPGGFRISNGLLDLDPNTFSFVQADVDGSGLKLLGFAQSLIVLSRSLDRQIDPVTKKERELGAPALRNAGLVLVHKQRAELLKQTIARQSQLNDAAEQTHKGGTNAPPVLFAEDLVRGYRMDVWDDVSTAWHSLCQRVASYDIDSGAVTIDVPEEEGTVRLAATTSPDPKSNPDIIWLHETLMAWPGWSLCVPPPGRTIAHARDDGNAAKDHDDPVTDAEPEVPPGVRLKSAFKVLPGSLPRLRYGRRYRLRARVVDLGGNSLPPDSGALGPELPAREAQPYYRYEPISAPAIALFKPAPAKTDTPAEGESMERLAVRSFNDTPPLNLVPTPQRARRFAVPGRTTQREAEQHGMLDGAGIVDPAFFAMLVSKDNSLPMEQHSAAGSAPGSPPVDTQYAVMVDGDELPYLPDPLAVAIAARIFNHPGFPDSTIIAIPLYDGTKWPAAIPFKIEIYDDPDGTVHYEPSVRTLFVPLPKAARCTLRLSVMPSAGALKVLGVWNWLTPAQRVQMTTIGGQATSLEKLARSGQHWMLTPWRSVELVHAVQRPLITPELTKIAVDRADGATFALPHFTATCSMASTDRIDLRANWNEPFEDVEKNTFENRARIDHAFSIKITDERSYAGSPEYVPQGTDLIRAGGFFHDRVGKKVHEFHDTRYRRIEYWLEATTKFREYMPPSLLTKAGKGGMEPTEDHIKVVGPKVRTWIPSSAPPPAPEVLYVVPTFGWVRSGDQENRSSWRRGGGLRVYLNRPWNVSGYGEMLGVVLPPGSFVGDPNDKPAGRPLKNYVTQWGNDPIWLSPFVAGVAPTRANFPLARTTPDFDGKWLPGFAPAEEADQPPGPFAVTGLAHPELLNPSTDSPVEVAPHDVFFDEERRLWYCDIEVTWGAAYFPFIRLALARYQPVASRTAHLSNVVLADFMPLVPDRWLNVTQTGDPNTRQVNVFGNTFTDSSSHMEGARVVKSVLRPGGGFIEIRGAAVAPSSVVDVWVERLNPALGEDFGWHRELGAVVRQDTRQPLRPRGAAAGTTPASTSARAADLWQLREFEALLEEGLVGHIVVTPTLWEGTVTLPQGPDETVRYRLAIAEYEEYLVDDETPYDVVATKKDRRTVFIEYVDLA